MLLGTNDVLLGTNDVLLGTNDVLLGTNVLVGADVLLGTNGVFFGADVLLVTVSFFVKDGIRIVFVFSEDGDDGGTSAT